MRNWCYFTQGKENTFMTPHVVAIRSEINKTIYATQRFPLKTIVYGY